MKILCAPKSFNFKNSTNADLNVILYNTSEKSKDGHIGSSIPSVIKRLKLKPSARGWDLLSIALSVISADLSGHRKQSSDGWTREFELTIAVNDPDFWNTQKALLNRQLGFLSTDIWKLEFVEDGFLPAPITPISSPSEKSVSLISGGLDSFVGVLDLVARGEKPYLVSQLVRGDAEKQRDFAQTIGGGLNHLQLNFNADMPAPESPPTQRARSFIFLAYGILMATCLRDYQNGASIPLYICENGFISMNPPLTGARLGSLSTRTTNPVFLQDFQRLLDNATLNVELKTPYQFKTKGEMLSECKNQSFLQNHAHKTTSCGRFGRFSYKHCGRCVPCLVRRASYKKWGKTDLTEYVYNDLSRDDDEHARYDDVRSVAMAAAQVKRDGLDTWLSGSVNSTLLGDTAPYKDVIKRGLQELHELLEGYKVK